MSDTDGCNHIQLFCKKCDPIKEAQFRVDIQRLRDAGVFDTNAIPAPMPMVPFNYHEIDPATGIRRIMRG